MSPVVVALATLAVVCTAAEVLHGWRLDPRRYHARELGADLGCAALGFGVLALHRGPFLALYSTVQARSGAWPWPEGGAGVALAFVLYDLAYYADHRSTHTVSWLWASHRVHHETTAFHLLTGLRMSMVGPVLGYPFRLPLAVLGVPPAVYLTVDVLHALLTYFTHARSAPALKLGWLLNTPAHHRLHHSSDPAHFGRNFGGVLLIWDRLFGTYHPAVPVRAVGDGETSEPLGPLAAHQRLLRAWL